MLNVKSLLIVNLGHVRKFESRKSVTSSKKYGKVFICLPFHIFHFFLSCAGILSLEFFKIVSYNCKICVNFVPHHFLLSSVEKGSDWLGLARKLSYLLRPIRYLKKVLTKSSFCIKFKVVRLTKIYLLGKSYVSFVILLIMHWVWKSAIQSHLLSYSLRQSQLVFAAFFSSQVAVDGRVDFSI